MSSWHSVHSAMKLAKAWDLIEVHGLNDMSKDISSKDHFAIHPFALRLWSISPSGNDVTTVTEWLWK
jgi:hypothetical protein